MNQEIQFLIKILRNAGILTGMMFVSIWATGGLNWVLMKPIVIFFMGYMFTELARHYKLTPSNKKINMTTLIF